MTRVYRLSLWGNTIGLYSSKQKAHLAAKRIKEPTHEGDEGYIMEYSIDTYELDSKRKPDSHEYEIKLGKIQ